MTSSEELKKLGNDAFSKGEFKKAAKIYRDAIALDSTNPVLFSNRAMSFIKLTDWQRAIRDCEAALKLECDLKTKEKVLYRYGVALKNSNNVSDALERFEEVLKINPLNEAARAELSNRPMNSTNTNNLISIPITETDTLPEKYRKLAEGMVLNSDMELDESHMTVTDQQEKDIDEPAFSNFADLPTMHHLASLHYLPKAQKEKAYRFVIESDGSIYDEVFADTGVDPQFLEFFIEASVYVSNSNCVNNWPSLVLSHFKRLSGYKRFQLSLVMCSNEKVDALIKRIAGLHDDEMTKEYKKVLKTD